MTSNRFSSLLSIHNICANNSFYLLLSVSVLVSFFFVSDVTARLLSDKYYLQIEHSKSSEETDLDITSFGVLAFQEAFVGHIKMTHLESELNGNGLTLDFAGGYVFNWDISLYVSFGVALGYNKDNSDYLAAYYPEAGIVADITKTFGITASTKRFHHLYKENENIIMFGLVFRD